MASVPGHTGFPILGDKSVEFYKDVISFVYKRIEQTGSRIFLSRLLNKPTVFVASNQGVRELLNDHAQSVDMGYKAFMHQVYGDNILFSDHQDAELLRKALSGLLQSPDCNQQINSIVDRLTKKHLKKIQDGCPVAVYEMFKRLATEICLSVFLDVDFEGSAELADQIVSLTTTHWHGIISVPVSLRVPGISKSTYSKALEAKGKLLDIIHTKLKDSGKSFPCQIKDARGLKSTTDAANHLLLFTSALVPKAIASLLTSFVTATSQQMTLQEEYLIDPALLEFTLLEVQRLWPPLIGGRRIAKKDFTLCGMKVPAGHAVVYLAHHAHRDITVFEQPHSFLPKRWRNQNTGDRDKLFVFGGGPRDCIGRHIVWNILMTVCRSLLLEYTWEIPVEEDRDANVNYKWLPVTRPRDPVTIVFHEQDKEDAEVASKAIGTPKSTPKVQRAS